jgi:hypothetical protein
MVVDDTMPEKDDTMSAEQAPVLKEMTVKKLRSLLKQHKLSTSGNKKTLIERAAGQSVPPTSRAVTYGITLALPPSPIGLCKWWEIGDSSKLHLDVFVSCFGFILGNMQDTSQLSSTLPTNLCLLLECLLLVGRKCSVCGAQTTTKWYGAATGVFKCAACATKARYYAAKDIKPSQVRMISLLHVHPIPVVCIPYPP